VLESPTGTQANKYVLSEITDKFSNVQEVAMFASLMLPILKNLGLSEFEARLPTIPPRRYFFVIQVYRPKNRQAFSSATLRAANL